MFIKKKALPRRTFLRGFGATLGLPLLDAMVPALSALAQTAASPVKRLGFIYLPNGVARNFTGINYWTPTGEGTGFELSPILSPLAPFRNRLLVVSGLAQHQADAFDDGANGDHTRGTSSWLTGVHCKRTEGADVKNGVSADQIAAQHLGQTTALPSLELAIDLNFLGGQCENSYSCAYLNTLAWSSDTTPLPTENNPRIVFERLFGDGGTQEQRLAQAKRNQSILDSVTEDLAKLQSSLGSRDRTTVTEYLDSVREVERRIQRIESRDAAELPTLERPAGVPDRFDERTIRTTRRSLRSTHGSIRIRPNSSPGSWTSCSQRQRAMARCSTTRCSCTARASVTRISMRTTICRSLWLEAAQERCMEVGTWFIARKPR